MKPFGFGFDIDAMLKLTLVLLPGDLDGDGFVGIGDLNAILSNWNAQVTAGDLLSGDVNGDGFVGIEDLNVVLGNWNTGVPPATGESIPEPGVIGMLGLGCAVGALSRKRRSAVRF